MFDRTQFEMSGASLSNFTHVAYDFRTSTIIDLTPATVAEGNWDLVGNDIPVFFIQDAIKFPDIIHAVKPEPHNEVPQGQSAHNNFWDFVGLQPECKFQQFFVVPVTELEYFHQRRIW